MEYIVETNRLTKRFGKELAVNGLDIKIPKGEIYGFLGPNGAGKTTTIRMLLGLMHPTSGTVKVFGKDLAKERIEILKQIGSLVENPSYYPHLTAYENLETIRKIYGAPMERINDVLTIVGLSDVAKKKVKGFSLGMKQRLGIAASLLNNPQLLILDEPTNGLDPSGIIEIRNLLKQLAAEYGITILISSHLLSEIDQIATSVGVISKGNLIFQDSIESMRLYSMRKILLKVNNSERAWHLLISRGVKADYEKEIISLSNMSDDDIAEVVRLLVENGYSIYRVEEEKRSLEDTFLQMTSEASGI
ncbi:ABC transporter ATP-binding protein [Ornithinibacillus scapharcae]|uniref:ABC transporter ATP-binding protein n=1 Tax=Ornithinibacillus scapharcae TaxID=1147159 RepID=UPI000225B8F7|nr:ABC transporter ATP-binding protein [Ornithinibacillus scapharcae]